MVILIISISVSFWGGISQCDYKEKLISVCHEKHFANVLEIFDITKLEMKKKKTLISTRQSKFRKFISHVSTN